MKDNKFLVVLSTIGVISIVVGVVVVIKKYLEFDKFLRNFDTEDEDELSYDDIFVADLDDIAEVEAE